MAFEDVSFYYPNQAATPALQGIQLEVEEGEFVAVAGSNGSGKSTFCHLINGLILPASGKVLTFDLDTSNVAELPAIRRHAALIMQNPDNQIIGPTVEDDVAFGLENLAFPRSEMQARVEEALEIMGLAQLRHREPHLLSLGERKRLAVAGALALHPRILVSDESTSMLDPPTREETVEIYSRLREEMGMTIIHATHHPEEILACDRVLVLAGGRLTFDGQPEELLERVGLEAQPGLRAPALFLVAHELQARGFSMPKKPLHVREVAERLWASS